MLLHPQKGTTGAIVMVGRGLTVIMKYPVSTQVPALPITVNKVVVAGLSTCCAAVESIKI